MSLRKALLEDVEQDPHAIQNRLLQSLKAFNADKTLRDLTDTIHLINSLFATIIVALYVLDDRNYRKKKADGTADGDIIEKFRPGWDKIKSDFNDLVWASKEVATTGAGHASKFGNLIVTILNRKEATLQEKKAELTQFIEELEASMTDAKNMSDKFSTLPDRITEVQTPVELALKEVEANFYAKLANVKESEAKQLQKVAELDAITKSVVDFKVIEAQVTLALKDTAGLSQRLLSIGNIWAAIRIETRLILEAIVLAQNVKTKWPFELVLGEQGVKAAYAKLEEVLILYSNGVSAVDPSHK